MILCSQISVLITSLDVQYILFSYLTLRLSHEALSSSTCRASDALKTYKIILFP